MLVKVIIVRQGSLLRKHGGSKISNELSELCSSVIIVYLFMKFDKKFTLFEIL